MSRPKKAKIPHKFMPWIAVRRQYKLTHAEVQMARELGLEPRRFAKYADTKDQPWKLPLKEFIAALYFKQTGLKEPDPIFTMEELAAAHVARRIKKKQAKAERIALGEDESDDSVESESDGEEIPMVETPAVEEPIAEKPVLETPVEVQPETDESAINEPAPDEPAPVEPSPVESAPVEPSPLPEPAPESPWAKAVAAKKQNENKA